MTLEEKLNAAIEIIKAEKFAFKYLVPYMVSSRISTAAMSPALTRTFALDADEESVEVAPEVGRELASEVAHMVPLVDKLTWSVGMTTKPGDIVLDPLEEYAYLYTGAEQMTHTNPMFYPGAFGVYYWAIIPKLRDFIKVYPNVDGIIVAVKQGEEWWNVDQTKVFRWKGADNLNCVWPPVEGNEWELVQPEAG